MQIGELSRRAGVSRRSLRYYEKCGLLDSRRGKKGWREYNEVAVIQVTNIKDLFASGLRTKDIQRLPPHWLRQRAAEAPACAEVAATYARRLAELDADIAELRARRERLEHRLRELLSCGNSSAVEVALRQSTITC